MIKDEIEGFEITDIERFEKRKKLPLGLKKRWLKALRSGKYSQGTGVLKQEESEGYSYCCLGVLCEIEKVPEQEDGEGLFYFAGDFEVIGDKRLLKYITPRGGFQGFEIDKFGSLASLNDNGYDFHEIADVIEKYF